nr:MAG TPA: hypothetical protein [Caudoviricetes sp.]
MFNEIREVGLSSLPFEINQLMEFQLKFHYLFISFFNLM